MNTEYPKVLIIGQSFEKKTGGGVTLSNLFQGWPEDRIAVAATNIDCSQYSICKKYYQLGYKENKWIWPINLVYKPKGISGALTLPKKNKYPNNRISDLKNGKNKRKIKRLFRNFLEKSNLKEILSYSYVSPGFYQWVKEYKPDLIYTWLGSVSWIQLISQLFEKVNIPFVIHFQDDWPIKFNMKGLLFSILIRKEGRRHDGDI